MDIDSILELLGLAEDIDIDIPDEVCLPDDSIDLDVDSIESDYTPGAYTSLNDQYNVSSHGDSDQFWINEKKSIEKEIAFCENQMNTNDYIQSSSYKTFINNKYAHALNKLKEVLKHI